MESTTIDLRLPIRASTSQVSSDVGSAVVILDMKQSAYIGLEGVGVRIWELILQGGQTGLQIRDQLLEEYDVDPKQCEEDVVRLLGELVTNNLIEIGHEKAA
jgi:hypothetical protein